MSDNVERMYAGDVNAILDGFINGGTFNVVNAIICSAKHRVSNNAVVTQIEKHRQNDTLVMGLPISAFANAALEVIGTQKYTGDDTFTLKLISSGFDW